MKKVLFCSLIALLMTSCYKQQFKVDQNAKGVEMKANPNYSGWNHIFLWGLVPTVKQDASQMCKDSGGVAFVGTEMSFVQGLLGGITYGIYSPRTYNIQCNK
jgi:hypothetical protein